MHSVFCVEQMKTIDGNNCLWQVDLALTSGNDSQLYALTEHICRETYPDIKGWHRLGTLLLKLDRFNEAQQVYEVLLDQTTDEGGKTRLYYILGMAKNDQGEYPKATEIYQKTRPPNHPSLAAYNNNIGGVHAEMMDYSKAVSFYERGLDIVQCSLSGNHLHL
jgi:tetratricopeptide (TPR) repeat protein